MGSPGDQSRRVQAMGWGRRPGPQEDRQTDGPARARKRLGVGRASLLPSRAPQVPQTWDPGEDKRQGFRVVGMPTRARSVGGPVEPKSFPRPHRAFPSPASGVNPLQPPTPPPLPRALETATPVPVPLAGDPGWRDTPFLSCGGWPAGSPRVSTIQQEGGGPRRAEGPAGQLCACPGQGGEAPWSRSGDPCSRGCWTPGALEGWAGVWVNTRRGSRWATSPRPGPPVGHRGLLGCRQGPLPSTGGQEAWASRRPEPGSVICFPELNGAEIRHKIISEPECIIKC